MCVRVYHLDVPLAWISLTLSLHSSLSSIAFSRSSGQHPVSMQSCFKISSSQTSYTLSSVWNSPQKNHAYEPALTSLAVSRMSCSSDFNGLGWEVGGHTAAVLWNVAPRICLMLRAAFWYKCHQAFFSMHLASMGCIHIVVWTEQLLEKITLYFIRLVWFPYDR